MWEPHLVVRGCCVWHACVERVFVAGIWWCRGCVPPCVGAPVCGWCVCGVDLFRHTALLLTLLWGTSFHIAGVWSVGLHPPSRSPPPPIPSRGSVVPVVGPPQHCTSAVPHNPHTPLLPQGCHAPDVLFYSLLVCAHKRYCFLFPLCCVSTLVCCPSHLATPLCGSAVCCSLCRDSVLPCVHIGVSCAQTSCCPLPPPSLCVPLCTHAVWGVPRGLLFRAP